MEAIQRGFDQLLEQLGLWGPRVLLGLFLIAVGWGVAKLLQRAATTLTRKLGVDKPFEQVNSDTGSPDIDESKRPSRLAGIGVYWLVMLFVIVGFFSAMNLNSIASPFNNVLQRIGDGLPNMIAAIALLVIGWLIATLVRSGVLKILRKFDFDKQIGKLGVLTDRQVEDGRVSGMFALVAYALVFLLFSQSALELIGLSMAASSLQRMINSAVDLVPAFLHAAAIAAIALLLASFLRPIVTSFLSSSGLDRLGRHIGFASEEKGRLVLSAIMGHIVYWLILLFAFPAVLERLGIGSMVDPLRETWSVVLESLPNVGGALLIVLAGYLICRIVGPIVQRILEGVGFDDILQKVGLVKMHEAVQGRDDAARPSRIATNIVLLVIALVLAQQVLATLGMGYLAELAARVVGFLPNILIAVAVLAFALFLGGYVSRLITAAMTGVDKLNSRIVASAANISIVVFGGAMALTQLKIAPDLVQDAVLLLIAAVCLAAAIAFGLGAKPVIEKYMEAKYAEWNR